MYCILCCMYYVVWDEVAVQARVKNCNVMAALSFRLQFKRNTYQFGNFHIPSRLIKITLVKNQLRFNIQLSTWSLALYKWRSQCSGLNKLTLTVSKYILGLVLVHTVPFSHYVCIRMCSMFNVAQNPENNAKIVLPENKKKGFLITGLATLIKAWGHIYK